MSTTDEIRLYFLAGLVMLGWAALLLGALAPAIERGVTRMIAAWRARGSRSADAGERVPGGVGRRVVARPCAAGPRDQRLVTTRAR